MVLHFLGSAALAAPPSYSTPNSLIGVSGGTPAVLSVRGEAWMAEGASFEIGGGVPLRTVNAWLDNESLGPEPVIFDAALRWRPRFLCVGCGRRVLGTFGLGLGAVVTPDVELLGPWTWALGPDAVATVVAWSTPTVGWHASLRLGGGAEWQGQELRSPRPAFWGMGTLGMAF